MTLTDALAAALHEHGAVHPDEYDGWDTTGCGPECAADILRDPAFREALTEAIFGAIREDMAEAGCGYIDFTWHPQSDGDDSDGGHEARDLAEAIAAHMLPG
jgi:hypothetical protein